VTNETLINPFFPNTLKIKTPKHDCLRASLELAEGLEPPTC